MLSSTAPTCVTAGHPIAGWGCCNFVLLGINLFQIVYIYLRIWFVTLIIIVIIIIVNYNCINFGNVSSGTNYQEMAQNDFQNWNLYLILKFNIIIYSLYLNLSEC